MTKSQKMVVSGLIGVVLLAFLALNVGASQFAYAPVMYRVMALQDVVAAREFLSNVKGSNLVLREGAHEYDVHTMQSSYLNSHFDNVFAREVDVERLSVGRSIEHYEGLLQLNRSNPQVLVKLGLLYREGGVVGDEEFLRKAKEIDPWIEVE